MGRAADALEVSDGQREVLDALARSQTLPFRVVTRARVLLLAADGLSNVEIAEVAGCRGPRCWRGGRTSPSGAWSISVRYVPGGGASRRSRRRRSPRWSI